MSDFFSLAELKAYLSITDSTDDALLTEFVGRASDAAESFLGYNIISAEYWEWFDGHGGRRVVLGQPQITRVYNTRTGVSTGLTLTSTDATDLAATVSILDNVLVLHRTLVDGSELTLPMAFSDSSYKTTLLIVNYINASAAGWSATLGTNVKGEWLHPVGGIDVKNTPFNMTYASTSASHYRVDYPEGILYLRSDPAFARNGQFSDETFLPNTRQSVFVNYQAGYASEDVPEDIKQAGLEIAASMYQRREHDQNLASESLGDYSYSMQSAAEVSESTRALLLPHRIIR